jgi:chromosome segregation protein
MFKLQRLEISGFKSFADYTEIVFTGSGITAVVGPNGCGKSNVSDAISWVLGEQRAKSLRGGEMKDVVFAGTRSRKPGGMAEVVLHLVRDDSVFDTDDNELSDIDEALSGIDEAAVDMDEIEGVDAEADVLSDEIILDAAGLDNNETGESEEVETVKAMTVGSAQVVETKIKTKRHWRPRSFALDFAPGEAVSVTRRLYLSGESEYQLNGKTCRLRDITDLFAGTGLSGAHYAIIEQGRIGQILSAKPADRRNLIEEAAGISKFRARQRAAESRLESAKSNLSRIFDIISEIETQVNSLRRQAAKTRRFKILQEEFRNLLRQLYAAEGKYLSDLSNELQIELGRAEEIETELQSRVKAQEEASREATQHARDAEESLAELRKIHANNILERDRAEREHLYKSDQIVSLNGRCDALRSEIASSKERLATLEGELKKLREDEARETAAHALAESELRSSEESYRDASAGLRVIESSIDTLRAELMQHTAAAERFDEIARQLANNLERLVMRATGLEREGVRAEETFESSQKHAEALARELAAEEEKLAGLNAEKDVLIASTTESRNALRAAEETLQGLHDEHAAKHHRLATLRELEEKKAVYAPQVQKLFAEQEKIGVKFSGVLADRLNVASDAETAVETLFGTFLEAVIVNSRSDAMKVAEWMRNNNIGRTAMVVLPAADHGDALTPNGTIASHLGIAKETAAVLSEIFPREMSAVLVDDIESAGGKAGEMLIDRRGDLALGGRMFVTGSRKPDGKNTSLLAFKRELNQLAKDCAKLDKAIEASKADVEKKRSLLVENESQTVDLQSLIIKVDRGIHGLQIQAHSAREEISRSERHRKVVADEVGQIASEIADLKQRRAEALLNQEAAKEARSATETALDTIGLDLATARQHAEAASTVLNEKRMIAATSDERRRSAVSALRRVENEYREIDSRITALSLELTENDARIKALHDSINEITDRISSASDEIAKEDAELSSALTALATARDRSDAMSDELAELNRRTVEARSQKAEIEIKQAEAATELKNTAENCQQELNVSLVDLVNSTELDEGFVLETARRDADDLRQKLDNFGAINMLALEELAEAEERHLFLTSQRTDIVDSIAATEEALREIKQRSRDRFKDAFEAINENFKQFFVELFGGGRGEMTLLEAEDILEAGIEVVAQPPGKRLQNIMLLSGGEKAMTAIALVLAIFKYRPSPFCLLDEVDAPLDDANVGRFAGKIAEMSEKTQFIVITHNKRTMEAARALYGVTMQEAGVSKIVSVKFE